MEQIKSELLALRLSGMAETLKGLQESRKIHELSLQDKLRLLVQGERDQRESNRYRRLVKNACVFRSDSATLFGQTVPL